MCILMMVWWPSLCLRLRLPFDSSFCFPSMMLFSDQRQLPKFWRETVGFSAFLPTYSRASQSESHFFVTICSKLVDMHESEGRPDVTVLLDGG